MTNNFLQKHLDLFTLNLRLDPLTLLLFNTAEFLERNSYIYSHQHKAKETTETQNPIEEADQIGQSTKIRFLVAEKEEREEGFAKVEIRLAPFLSNVELDKLNTPNQLLLETFEKMYLPIFFILKPCVIISCSSPTTFWQSTEAVFYYTGSASRLISILYFNLLIFDYIRLDPPGCCSVLQIREIKWQSLLRFLKCDYYISYWI